MPHESHWAFVFPEMFPETFCDVTPCCLRLINLLDFHSLCYSCSVSLLYRLVWGLYKRIRHAYAVCALYRDKWTSQKWLYWKMETETWKHGK